MATKRFYRVLDLNTGRINLSDWVFDGQVSLNEIIVQYEDELLPEHAQMIADAIDKRVEKLNADIVVMQNRKQDFLAIAYQAHTNKVCEACGADMLEVNDSATYTHYVCSNCDYEVMNGN